MKDLLRRYAGDICLSTNVELWAADRINFLEDQVSLMEEALETAKECLENNGFGKAYVLDLINNALGNKNETT